MERITYSTRIYRLGFVILLLLILLSLWAVLQPDGLPSAFAQYPNPYYRNPYASAPVTPHRENLLDNNGVQHLIAFLLGCVIGAFFSQRLRKFRRALITLLVLLSLLLLMIVSPTVANIGLFLIGFMVAWWLLRVVRTYKRSKPTTFGSAEWADIEHLAMNDLIGDTGLRLGVYEGEGRRVPLHYTGNRHLLTVAPTRSGKGVAAILLNLLTYLGSAVIVDPKGENAMISAARRGPGNVQYNIPGMKQKVHIVDPWGITGLPVSCFNPLDWLKQDDPDISENAMMLADSIIVPSAGGEDRFWDEEAKALLMGILLYVALDAAEQDNRHLGRVRDIVTSSEEKFMDVMERMAASTNPIVVTTAERTAAKEPKLRSNVIAALQSHTHFLDSPRIRDSVRTSDFRFEDLKTSRMTVYLVLPADRLKTFGRWLRLLVQQAITVNARNIATVPDKPILFLLDEMAALDHLTMVEQAYSLMAGFGMQLWGIVQDLGQLERVTGKGWETYISNAGVVQYFGSRDNKTADYFSKLCGVTTVEKFSFTRAIARVFGQSSSSTSGPGGGSFSSGSSSSTSTSDSSTYDVVQRHLAYPDELMVLRDDKQLLFIETANPIPGKKIRWYQHETMKQLGINLMGPRPANDNQPQPIPARAA